MNSTVQDVRLNDLTVSWTVNFDQFHTRMRDLEIVSLVEHLINPTAAEIVRVMLSHDESLRLFTDQMSREISISRIKEAIDPIFKFRVEFAEVEPLLEYLGALQSEHFVTKIDDYSGVLYAVEIGKIVTTLKTRIIENIISERFGDNATRIWRVLKTNGKLDDKQISKFALIDPQKVRELLYKMLSFNLVFMQDVPKTNDHSSSRTVFLWDVSMEKCIANVLGECYSAMANLKARFIHENDVNSVLLSKMARTDVKEDFDILEEVEKKSWDDLCRNKDLINGSIDEIDRTVFILRDL